MIPCASFYDELAKNSISFFSGVPDSLLKDFCAYITDHVPPRNHVIAANEGGAISLAAGYHLATGKIPLVYMQNSGQGNAINPLVSLADPEVYGIPILLLIGWRGEPGVHDEPQHVKQGKVTMTLLDALGIPYEILGKDSQSAGSQIEKAIASMRKRQAPHAIIVKKGTFEEYKLQKIVKTDFNLTREEALKAIIDHLEEHDIVVSTTGMTSRELFEYREALKQEHSHDFLTVGSMGHSSQIALGIALQKPNRQVYCFDGDGAVIMHMGSLAIIGQHSPRNYRHIIFNNGAHDSVGGQPTAAFGIDLLAIAKANRYKAVMRAQTKNEIEACMRELRASDGPTLLEIKVNKGVRKELGRPTTTPLENKKSFMEFLRKNFPSAR